MDKTSALNSTALEWLDHSPRAEFLRESSSLSTQIWQTVLKMIQSYGKLYSILLFYTHTGQ